MQPGKEASIRYCYRKNYRVTDTVYNNSLHLFIFRQRNNLNLKFV